MGQDALKKRKQDGHFDCVYEKWGVTETQASYNRNNKEFVF